MIDFKDKDSQVPSAIIVASLLILLGTLVFMMVVPRPAPPKAFAKEKQLATYKEQIVQAKLSLDQSQKTTAALIFRGRPEDIMARALAMLTQRAQKDQVQIVAFRPQKTIVLGGLTELPVNMQVTGPYPELLAFLNGLSAPGSHVAVSSFQVASSGDATSTVTANLNVALFAPLADTLPSPAPRTSVTRTPAARTPAAGRLIRSTPASPSAVSNAPSGR